MGDSKLDPSEPSGRQFGASGELLPPSEAHALLRNAAASVSKHIEALGELADQLRLSEGGPFAFGPAENSPGRDVAKALHVAFTAIVTVEALALDPGWPTDDREKIRRAYNCVLGGHPDREPRANVRLAASITTQAIRMINRIGFWGFPEEAGFELARNQLPRVCGPVMNLVDIDEHIRRHARLPHFNTPEEAAAIVEEASLAALRDLVWAALSLTTEGTAESASLWINPTEPARQNRRALRKFLAERLK